MLNAHSGFLASCALRQNQALVSDVEWSIWMPPTPNLIPPLSLNPAGDMSAASHNRVQVHFLGPPLAVLLEPSGDSAPPVLHAARSVRLCVMVHVDAVRDTGCVRHTWSIRILA